MERLLPNASDAANQHWLEATVLTASTIKDVRTAMDDRNNLSTLGQEAEVFITDFLHQMYASDLVAQHPVGSNYKYRWQNEDLETIKQKTEEDVKMHAIFLFGNNPEVTKEVRKKSYEIARRIYGLTSINRLNLIHTLGTMHTELNDLIHANKKPLAQSTSSTS